MDILRIIVLSVGVITYCAGAAHGESREVPPSTEVELSSREAPIKGLDETPTPPTPTSRRVCDDRCGNGQCEEIVCMAVGCPCAESHTTCSQDCPAQ